MADALQWDDQYGGPAAPVVCILHHPLLCGGLSAYHQTARNPAAAAPAVGTWVVAGLAAPPARQNSNAVKQTPYPPTPQARPLLLAYPASGSSHPAPR